MNKKPRPWWIVRIQMRDTRRNGQRYYIYLRSRRAAGNNKRRSWRISVWLHEAYRFDSLKDARTGTKCKAIERFMKHSNRGPLQIVRYDPIGNSDFLPGRREHVVGYTTTIVEATGISALEQLALKASE